jgi:hypothetical protein
VSWPRFEQHSSQMQVKNATATPIGSTPSWEATTQEFPNILRNKDQSSPNNPILFP